MRTAEEREGHDIWRWFVVIVRGGGGEEKEEEKKNDFYVKFHKEHFCTEIFLRYLWFLRQIRKTRIRGLRLSFFLFPTTHFYHALCLKPRRGVNWTLVPHRYFHLQGVMLTLFLVINHRPESVKKSSLSVEKCFQNPKESERVKDGLNWVTKSFENVLLEF